MHTGVCNATRTHKLHMHATCTRTRNTTRTRMLLAHAYYSHTHATRTRILLSHACYSHTHATCTRDFTTTCSTINTFFTRVYRVEHTRVTREHSLGYSRALASRTHSLIKLRLSGTVCLSITNDKSIHYLQKAPEHKYSVPI